MNRGITKKMLPLAVPPGLLVLARLFLLKIGLAPVYWLPVIQYSPYAALAIVLILSYRFTMWGTRC
ncbi:MAG: hypothetical protein ACOY40_11805 [Bacillota bacterium]